MTWNATHRVPDGGLPTFVNNQPSTPLDPGLEVEVAEQSGDWARVVTSNGWECWVDGGPLVPLAAAAAPVAAVAAAGPPSAGPPPTPPADLPPQAPPATPAAAGPPPTPPPYQTGQPPRILTQLNRQESRHALARDVFHGRRGNLYQAYRTGQEQQLGALGLVCNAVTLWNSRYTDRAIAVLVGRGRQVDPTDLERLSPLHHETINLHGRYTFNIPDAVRAGALRPLPLSAGDA